MLKIIKRIKNKILNKPQPTYFLSGDEGVDDEYFINEIIGIEELPYEEFIKEKKDNNEKPKKPVQLELPFEEFKREKN